MVILSNIFAYAAGKRTPRRIRKYLIGKFIDSIRLQIKTGGGGMGHPRFGGLGGKGGDIYLVSKEGETLTSVYKTWPLKHIQSETGQASSARKLIGEPGVDKFVTVPPGITVIDQNGRIIGTLDEPDMQLLVGRGGAGGTKDTDFQGTPGQSFAIRLDLQLIADVGLVGFPNAGKSTLLRALSRATPKVASYPFTTVRPEIGMMQYRDLRQISVADLPGLLEGAHSNRGMGHSFLRHVERTKLLLLVADVTGFQLSVKHPHRTCLETVFLLNKELELYKDELMDKPAFLVINKLDLPGAQRMYEELHDQVTDLASAAAQVPEELRPERPLKFEGVMGISADKKGDDIRELKYNIRRILDQAREEELGLLELPPEQKLLQ